MATKRKKKETPCDRGEHKLFDTLGGDQLCALGCGLRIEGEGKVAEPVEWTVGDWVVQFNHTVGECAKSFRPFTSEQIVEMVGLPTHKDKAKAAIGGLMNDLGRSGVIEKTGRSREGNVEWVGK
jgi:hypothetical protein